MRVGVAFFAVFYSLLNFSTLYAESKKPEKPHDPLAIAFGSLPAMTDPRLSPDGSKISFLSTRTNDLPILVIFDTKTGQASPIMSSVPDKFDIKWCDWANNERLLCGFSGVYKEGFDYVPVSRLVGINADGSRMKVLLEQRLENQFTQYQDRIVDWLVDDPRHILVQIPSQNSTGIARLDIYSGTTGMVIANRENVHHWVSDGHGSPRLYRYHSEDKISWSYRLPEEDSWHEFHEARTTDDDDFDPAGFSENADELLVLKPLEGHIALWALDLRHNLKARLVYAAPDADISSSLLMGKYRRLVAVSYSTDQPHLHFLDYGIEAVTRRVQATFPGKLVQVVDESWDQKFYIVMVSSDQDAGAYYVYNAANPGLTILAPRQPELAGRQLGEMKPVEYPAADGTKIPAYLTLPPGKPAKGLPVIILPHGGPTARDDWGFDWLVQYLAAKGFAVLQSNYRGSAGYGKSWEGENAFHGWRKAIADVNDGAKWLITQGIADPNQVCILGWSYGGYAALMGSIETPGLYKCVVSIAGVTDPRTFISDHDRFMHQNEVRKVVGTESEVTKNGSPLKRAAEFKAPVLLLHGEKDINVAIRHSEYMDEALRKAGKSTELVTYKDVEHHFLRNEARIDMLDRIGVFLEKYLGPVATSTTTTADAK
jgi:dipeptidyl aminopeptidase/acylaminoacyl peptidase